MSILINSTGQGLTDISIVEDNNFNTSSIVPNTSRNNSTDIFRHLILNTNITPYNRLFLDVGDTLHLNGQYEQAILLYKLCIIPNYLHNKHRLSILYGKIANSYANLSKPLSVLFYLHKCLAFCPYAKESEVIRAKTLTNISSQLIRISDYNKALLYMSEAQKVFLANNQLQDMAVLKVNMASINLRKRESDSALINYKHALSYIDSSIKHQEDFFSVKSKRGILYSISDIFISNKNADSAIYYTNRFTENKFYETAEDVAMHHYLKGGIFYVKEDYDKSRMHFRECINIAESNNLENFFLSSYGRLMNLYLASHQYKKAWDYGHKYINLLQKEFEKTKVDIHQVNHLESQFQIAQKDKEIIQKQLLITRQEKNLTQQKLWIVSISLSLLVLLIVIYMLYRSYTRKKKLLLQEKEIEQLKSIMKGEENERSRLARELHDGIGGMLAAIKMNLSSVKKVPYENINNKIDTLLHMLNDTSSEVRTTAHNLMPHNLSKYGLIHTLSQYIQKINDTHNLKIDLHIPNDLELNDISIELVLYRIIQELVQNIIKHAAATHVEIQLIAYNKQLVITVEDNGKGFDVNEPQYTGFGLENLRYRISALSGELDIRSVKGKSTTFRIEFNLEKLKLVAN